MTQTTRAAAEQLDRADPLRQLRDEFAFESDSVYMDGNSLGRLPKATIEASNRLLSEWGRDLVGGWDRWIDFPAQAGALISESLLGGKSEECVVGDSTSINLYKAASAAAGLRPDRNVILTDDNNFPSDLYVLFSVAESRGMQVRMITSDPVMGTDAAEVARHIDESVALVALSHVDYKSGALADMTAISSVAHDAGALVIWDLCHSVGAVPLDLAAAGCDLAVGCTYKYLNGGPGSPAFVFARGDLVPKLHQPLWGWFGSVGQFLMESSYRPAPDIRRFLVGTPAILSMVGIQTGVELIVRAGIERLREKSIAITELMIEVFDEWLQPLGMELGSPRPAALRGSHLAFRHPEAYRISTALIEKFDVIPDFREPDTIRFGIAPIYTRFVDAHDAMTALKDVLQTEAYADFPAERRRVT